MTNKTHEGPMSLVSVLSVTAISQEPLYFFCKKMEHHVRRKLTKPAFEKKISLFFKTALTIFTIFCTIVEDNRCIYRAVLVFLENSLRGINQGIKKVASFKICTKRSLLVGKLGSLISLI